MLSPSGHRIIRLPIQGVTMTSLWQKGVILVLQVTANEPWNRNLKSQGSLTKTLSFTFTTNTESQSGF